MKYILLLVIVIASASAVQDPVNILIYTDQFGGYGEEVVQATDSLWPSANVMAYHDAYTGPTAFNADMNNYGDSLDILIIDCWCGFYDEFKWDVMKGLYDAGTVRIYASCWKWSGPSILGNAMGISAFSDVSTVITHYPWDTGHPITSGITDWGWSEPGVGVMGIRMTVSDAVPITGWTPTQAVSEAGICVANDGHSVISGYTLAFANKSFDLWTNILEFMWGDPQSLQNGTWAGIKASF